MSTEKRFGWLFDLLGSSVRDDGVPIAMSRTLDFRESEVTHDAPSGVTQILPRPSAMASAANPNVYVELVPPDIEVGTDFGLGGRVRFLSHNFEIGPDDRIGFVPGITTFVQIDAGERTTNTVPQELRIRGQAPWLGATLAARTPGAVELRVMSPVSGGDEGQIRFALRDGAKRLVVTGNGLTSSPDRISIQQTGASGLEIASQLWCTAETRVQIAGTGPSLVLTTTATTARIGAFRPVSDVAPEVVTIGGGQGGLFATGANRPGGPLRLHGGGGRADGTDLAGDVFVGLGTPLATGETARFRVVRGNAHDTFGTITDVLAVYRNGVAGGRTRIEPAGDTQVVGSGAFLTFENTVGSVGFQANTGLTFGSSTGAIDFLGVSGSTRVQHRYPARVTTTNATVTTAATIATETAASYLAFIRVVARNGAQAAYDMRALIRQAAGVAVVEGLTTPFVFESNAALDATLLASGTDVQVRVTGLAATTIDWTVNIELHRGT